MKADLCYKTAELDVTYDDIEQAVRDKLEPGYDFKINSYRVVLNWDTEESTVYVEYTRYPKKIRLDTSNIEVPHNVFDGLQKDMKENSFKGLSEAIVNALDNYYE